MYALTERWTPITEQGEVRLTGERRALWDASVPQADGRPRVLHAVVDAARQALKTELFAKRLPILYLPVAKPWKDPRYLYGAPTSEQAKSIIWEDWKKLIPKHWIAYKNEQELFIRTVFGSELHCKGLDKPSRVEGKSWDGVIIDESADLKPAVWDEHLEMLLAARNGWSRHLGTPDYSGTGTQSYKRLVDYAATSGDDEWRRYTWHSDEVIPPERIERARQRLTSLAFRQEYKAEWVSAPGRAFWEYRAEDHKKPTEFIPGEILAVSCDFNFGYHNWIMAQVLPRAIRPYVRVFDQVFLESAATPAMCRELRRKIIALDGGESYLHTKGRLQFYGDWSGTQKRSESPWTNWEVIAKEFPNAAILSRPSGPIKNRIEQTNETLCTDREGDARIHCQIDPRCENLHTDLEFVRTKDLYSDSKTGPLTHAADCFGYLIVQSHEDIDSTAKTTDLSALSRNLF